jgi:RNA polymerase sigma factor (TIGR02999 family)
MIAPKDKTTRALTRLADGDGGAAEELIPLLYDQLRAIAAAQLRREAPGRTIQPTALVHEAYLRLVDQSQSNWECEAHFLALAARVMRQILIDQARARNARKRGGGARGVTLHPEMAASPDARIVDTLALDEAIERLTELSERQARIVEMRCFGGMTVEQCARALAVSERTVKGDWRVALAWLERELGADDS